MRRRVRAGSITPWNSTSARIASAILAFDQASLAAERNDDLLAFFSARGWEASEARLGRGAPRKAMLVQEALAYGHADRCRSKRTIANNNSLDGSGLLLGGVVTVETNVSRCGPMRAFDVGTLPYRWLPGLPVRRIDAARAHEYYRTEPLVEVMHIRDWWEGDSLWLYGAPGSGVWWQPGRRLVTSNLVTALLHFRSVEEVAELLRRRRHHPAYPQWVAAFGGAPWEHVLRGAASGDATYSLFAMAGQLLAELLAPPKGSLDSIILLEQMHFWPRANSYSFAPEAVAPCADVPPDSPWRAPGRILHVPEIIDLRVRSITEPNNSLYKYLRADAAGTRPCWRGAAEKRCTGCSARGHALCECAVGKQARRRGLGLLVHADFDARGARKCCEELYSEWDSARSD